MTALPQLNCRGCGSPLIALPAGGRVRAATRFDDCLRRCESCGVGASNAENADAVTWIYRNPLDSIPGECHRGALDALGSAFNVRNRESKRRRFGFFPASEDAVTWVVFTHLLRSGQLLPALQRAGMAVNLPSATAPTLLLPATQNRQKLATKKC